MSKRTPRRKAVKTKAFTETTDLNEVEKVAASAAAANKKAGMGHNSGGMSDDELKLTIEKIKEQKGEVSAAKKVYDREKGVLQNLYKVAKDKGAPTDEIREYLALKELTTGAVVTSHRNFARIARLEGDPLYTQYDLWKSAEVKADEADAARSNMEPELQGQHAYSNSEPLSNNPFLQGTVDYVDWETGWKNAEKGTAARMQPNGAAAAAAPAN
ncbi:MAG: hypothetical protein K9G48_13875 [Reyranella sp.]|nr:hypothetical protein [Reyranella sp.]